MYRLLGLAALLVMTSCSGSSTAAEDAVIPSTTNKVTTTQIVSEAEDLDSTEESAPPLLANDDVPDEEVMGGDTQQFCDDIFDLSRGKLTRPTQLYAAYDRMAVNAPAEIHDEVQEFVRLSRLISEAVEPYRDDPEKLDAALEGLEPAATEMLMEMAESSQTGMPGAGPASATFSWALSNCDESSGS